MTDSTGARLRVAPSPTGDPHVGTAYMALFNLAYARKAGGKFALRIEDTDRARFREDSEQQIFESLRWLGLDWDEGPDVGGPYAPYRQSERLETYRPHVERLIAEGHAYYCWCSPQRLAELRDAQAKSKQADTGYDRLCLGMTRDERAKLPGFSDTPVVRMLIPDDAPLTFSDVIRGAVKAPRPDDQVILKADGFPTYHLAVVVDDHLMGITHVVRGEEWISSTPKHILLYRWLGWDVPAFAHMPLLRNQDKSKISKRKNPAARLLWFRERGYLPEALRNFLQLMGYPCEEGHEVTSFAEFVDGFEWSKVNTVGPVFDLKKLDWLNGAYIRALSDDELAARIEEHLRYAGTWGEAVPARHREILRQGAPIIKERLVTLDEALPKLGFLLADDDDFLAGWESDESMREARGGLRDDAVQVIDAAVDALAGLADWNADALHETLQAALVDGLALKPKFAFAPVRVAVTGSRVSPPLFESMAILGRDSCLRRLRALR
ncbi:MAG: glutamate--tRNA ligase [Propionibacteriaceae bacterium]|jgi:glutamyl-tRNA synthetase|nr:glutamate--tRNA ligase [Propionibacteriaceae bacterium]